MTDIQNDALARQAEAEILGARGPEVGSMIDLYDHEILAIEQVAEALNAKRHKRSNIEAFDREIHERFFAVGLVVDVRWFTGEESGWYYPMIQIEGRTDAHTFDPDRQVHEVTHDLLDLGTEQSEVIKTDGGLTPTHHHH